MNISQLNLRSEEFDDDDDDDDDDDNNNNNNNNITQLRRSVHLTIFLHMPVPHPIITNLHMASRNEFCGTMGYSYLKPIKPGRIGS